jgi:DNA-binding transcriptional MerR regulator
MWECRYGFPSAERRPNGNRAYTEDTVQLLILAARALRAGFRPGEVVGRSRKEVESLLERAALQPPPPVVDAGDELAELVDTIERSDVLQLRAKLKHLVAKLGTKRFLTDIVSPLLADVDWAWAAGRIEVRHEHLMSEVLTTQLRTLLASYDDLARGPCVLLAALPEEQHRLGLEMVPLYLAIEGVVPRMLGADSPAQQIAAAARGMEVDLVGWSISASFSPAKASTYVRGLPDELPPEIEVWAGAANASQMRLRASRLHVARSLGDIDALLRRLRDRRGEAA